MLNIEYRVLCGSSAKSLEEQVVDLTKEGYQPQGGVSLTFTAEQGLMRGSGIISAPIFAQAMVKVTEATK